MTPPVPSIIPKGIATPSLIAQIITSKYVDGLPLYRQERIFEHLNIDLSRGTMARWIVQAAEACQPIWNCLEERLLIGYPFRISHSLEDPLLERRMAHPNSGLFQ
jgi:transposase